MDEIDSAVNAAVLRIRQQFRQAQRSLGLPMSTFVGVPTFHTCEVGGPRSSRCAACWAES